MKFAPRCLLFSLAILGQALAAAAACVQVVNPSGVLATFQCDIFSEADLRALDLIGNVYPFPSIAVTLRADVTLNGPVSFAHINDLEVNTNGFSLTGAVDGNGTMLRKTGAGTLVVNGTSRAELRTLMIQGGTVRVSTDLVNDFSQDFQRGRDFLTLGDTTFSSAGLTSVTFQAGAPLTIGWGIGLAGGGGTFGLSWARQRIDETFDTNGFEVALTGHIYGTGRLVKTGAGRLTLTGENQALGGVMIREGILRVASDRSLGILPSESFTVCENSPYDGPPCTYASVMAPLVVDGGTLEAGATFAVARSVVLGPRHGTFDTAGFTLTLSGTVDGAGGLTKNGAGTLVLAGPATYAGATVVNAGTLLVGASNALPAGTVVTLASGGTLDGNGQNLLLGSLSGAGTVLGRSGSLFVGAANTSTMFGGTIASAFSLTKTGAGTLSMTAAQPYNGVTRVAAGRLDVAGLAGPVVVDGGALLSGSGRIGGSVDVAGTLTAGAAPLTIAGDLRLGRSATLEIPVSTAPASLRVGGRTTIDGATLALIGAAGSLPRVTTVPLFTSSGPITGGFSIVAAPSSVDAIMGSNQSTTFVVLERTDVSLASLATTGDGHAAGAAVDALRTTATGDLQRVLREVGALGDAEVGDALAQLGGRVAPGALHAGALDAQDALRSVNDRIVDVRSTSSERNLAAGASSFALRRAGVWFKAAGADRTIGTDAESARVCGGIAGVDHVFAGGAWLVGAFGGYDRATLDRDEGGRARDRRFRAGGYTAMTRARVYVAGAVSGAAHRFDLSRHLSFAATLDPQLGGGTLFDGVDRTAASRFGGREVSGFVESGLAPRLARVAWQPFVGIDASHLTADTFMESGAGAVSLAVSDATATSLRPAAGVRALSRITIGGRVATPHAEVRYLREVADAASSMHVTFTDAPAQPFEIHGDLPGRNFVGAAAGVTLFGVSRVNLSADYRGVFTAGDQRHTVAFGVAF
jgi:autotransporter-associated beta strand protein